MGMFSWFTQDTHERIVNGKKMHVVMTDDKGNRYVEECYEGYGVFGGKDYFELLAEMNGFKLEDFGGDNDKLRSKGISLAFDGDPSGMNPKVLHPSLTRSGIYCDGLAPEPDPDQGNEDLEVEIHNEIENLCELGCYMEKLAEGDDERAYPLPDEVLKELEDFARHFVQWRTERLIDKACECAKQYFVWNTEMIEQFKQAMEE